MKARHKVSEQDEEAVKAAVSTIVKVMLPEAKKRAELTSRAPYSVLTSLLRPYIDEAVTPRKVKRTVDNRTRLWWFKIYFWDITNGLEAGDLIAQSDLENERGFDAIVCLIRQWVKEVHAGIHWLMDQDHDFNELSLKKRLGGLRPAITRGSGKATLRIYYVVHGKRYLCQVDISRFKG